MSGEVNNLNLGKLGQVKLNGDKGVQKSAFGDNEVAKSIFDHYDTDKNGILDEQELNKMNADLTEAAASKGAKSRLGKREAAQYLKNLGVESQDARADIKAFMDAIGSEADNVESAQKLENGSLLVNYKASEDGSVQKELYTYINGSKTATLSQREETKNNVKTTTNFENDGKTPKNEIVTNGTTTVTTSYENGEIQSRVKVQGQTTTELDFENNNRPIKTTTGDIVTTYYYDQAGKNNKTVVQKPGQQVTTEKLEDGSTVVITENKNADGEVIEEIKQGTDAEGNTSKVITKMQGGFRTSQTVEVNGETALSVEYDGKGNTKGVIVQNGESPQAIAEKFNVSVQDLLAANPEAVKGKAPKQYFLVGAEIKIPGELDADQFAQLNAGRGDKASQLNAYRQEEMARVEKRLEGRRTKEVNVDKDYKHWTQYATEMLKNEGGTNPTQAQIVNRTNELMSLNPDIKVPKKGDTVNVMMTEKEILLEDYHKSEAANTEIRQAQAQRERNKQIAYELYDIVLDNHGNTSMTKLNDVLTHKVNSKNIVGVLDAYAYNSQKGLTGNDTSLIDSIMSEGGDKGPVLKTLMNDLIKAAKDAGVRDEDINAATKYFWNCYQGYGKENGIRSNKVKNMEKSVDFLRGAIVAAQKGGQTISFADAMKMTSAEYKEQVNQAKADFDKARDEEGLMAKAGDGITWAATLGSTNTIHRMKKRLGAAGEVVAKLEAAANSGNETEFKRLWKENFGVKFDEKKVAARDKMQSNINTVKLQQGMIESLSDIAQRASGMNLDQIKSELKWDDATFNQVIEYGRKNYPSLDDKQIVMQALQNSITDIKSSMAQNMGGKSIEQMDRDLELLNQSVYGTTDIGKDIAEFNQNMQKTEMAAEITEMALEVAATVALTAVTCGGTAPLLAARVGTIATRCGSMGVKVARVANTTAKVLRAESKVARAVNMGTDAFIVSTTMKTIDQKGDIKEGAKHGLMMAEFAAGGAIAGESVVAQLATNFVVSKANGIEYTTTNGAIDASIGMALQLLSRGRVHNAPKTAPKPQPKSTTPTLDRAVSLDAAGNMQAPGSVGKLNPQKKAQVQQEVVEAALDPHSTPEVMAQKRKELDAIGGKGNRDLRRQGQRTLDEGAQIADQLEPGFEGQYTNAVQGGRKQTIDRMFDANSQKYNSMINESDIRIIKEYARDCENPAELETLMKNIKNKYYGRGGQKGGIAAREGYDGYADLKKTIEDRIEQLKKPQVEAPAPQPVKLTKAQAKSFREMNTEFNKIASMKQGEESVQKFNALKEKVEAMPDCKQKTELLENINGRLDNLAKKGFTAPVETPKTPAETPVVEKPAPKAETPAATPKAEPKAQAEVKAETPQAEPSVTSKAETPVAEKPVVEKPAPKAETPAQVETPVAPKAESINDRIMPDGARIPAAEIETPHGQVIRDMFGKEVDRVVKEHVAGQPLAKNQMIEIEREITTRSSVEQLNKINDQLSNAGITAKDKKAIDKMISNQRSKIEKYQAKQAKIEQQKQAQREKEIADKQARLEAQQITSASDAKAYYEQIKARMQSRSYRDFPKIIEVRNKLEKFPEYRDELIELDRRLNPHYARIYNVDNQAPVVDVPSAHVKEVEAFANVKAGENLQKNVGSVVEPNSKLVLGGQYELDLSNPQIKAKLEGLKEGQTITVGREGDIHVPGDNTRVSRKHLEITKQNGQIVVKDVSTNGTKVKTPAVKIEDIARKLNEPNINNLKVENGVVYRKGTGFIRQWQQVGTVEDVMTRQANNLGSSPLPYSANGRQAAAPMDQARGGNFRAELSGQGSSQVHDAAPMQQHQVNDANNAERTPIGFKFGNTEKPWVGATSKFGVELNKNNYEVNQLLEQIAKDRGDEYTAQRILQRVGNSTDNSAFARQMLNDGVDLETTNTILDAFSKDVDNKVKRLYNDANIAKQNISAVNSAIDLVSNIDKLSNQQKAILYGQIFDAINHGDTRNVLYGLTEHAYMGFHTPQQFLNNQNKLKINDLMEYLQSQGADELWKQMNL